jgi:hypothetical protein
MDEDHKTNLNDLPQDLLMNILLGCKKGCNPRGICKDISVVYDDVSLLKHLLLSDQPFFIILRNIIKNSELEKMEKLIDAAMETNSNEKKHILNAWKINFLIRLYGMIGTDRSALVIKAFANNIVKSKFNIPDDEVKPLLYYLIWEDLDQDHTFNMCDNPLPSQSTYLKWQEQKLVLIKALITVKGDIIFENIDNAGILRCFVAQPLEWASVTSVNPMNKFGPLPLMHNDLYTLLRSRVENQTLRLGPSIGKSLILAAAIGSLQIVTDLITNVAVTSNDRQVALEMAITYDHVELVEHLLKYTENESKTDAPLISSKGILHEGSFSGEPMMRASGFNANIAGYKPANKEIMEKLVLVRSSGRGEKHEATYWDNFLANDPMKSFIALNNKPKNKPVYLRHVNTSKIHIITSVIQASAIRLMIKQLDDSRT